ncbi:Peptidoglycan-binding lysin domain protein [Solidesulfovibrio fructosivorans JJ]]|uniref:Peptidoglycan-binding lysin domain protein n=1 Tax=Solidesulfovibrio fructosivorans JJ] TaxID=596151 RepID=E1JWU2_SOLFR|nr:LysM peptidoglycan-binding domain-containing protein [Solidesulfovibrio fructosivorans]EFL51146.1 Peptidoglycan-binding lysin domain protein [Solidesulfovibrio fructosivorans JJ]]
MPRLSRLVFPLLCLSLLATVRPAEVGAYTVKAGDTPVSIAKKHGVSVQDLLKANKGLDPRKMRVGESLTIPGGSSGKADKKHSEKEPKKEKAGKKAEGSSEKERAALARDKVKESKSQAKSGSYKVKKGDTLGAIAAKYDVSVDELLKANKSLHPKKMRIGQELVVPGAAPAKAEPAEKPARKAEKSRESHATTSTYTAHKRDTVHTVARKFHISVKELYRLNPGLGKKLHSGQKLNVPSKAVEPEAAPARTPAPEQAPAAVSEPERPASAPRTPEAAAPTEPAKPAKTAEPEAAPAKTGLQTSDAEAAFEKGIEFGKQNKFQQAVDSFNKAIKLNPNRADFYASRGHAHYYMKQYAKAIDDYTKAIEKNPNFALAYSMRGLSRTRSGQYQQAITDFNKAIGFGPNEADYYKGRGFTYLHLKQYGPMCEDYKKACTLGDCELLDSAKKEKLCQ